MFFGGKENSDRKFWFRMKTRIMYIERKGKCAGWSDKN